ncbi:MAG: hypothetical protein M1816_006588 [Peltula sp. TS41687]|nr:MAG: hypothetical protein M1816_006588 [Peltula sp. TS41687]
MGMRDYASPASGGSFVGFILRLCLRSLQFVMALAVAGLYGTDLNSARKHGVGGDPKWVYAVAVSGISALTCIVYMIPFVKSHLLFVWDAVLFILWVAVFGCFGKMYLHEDPEGNAGVQRMKNAVWVDLINMLLWFTSAAVGAFIFLRARPRNSRQLGRVTV